tara:strand:+ start:14979 stop:15560 length:582 start_codon:yes stop_codon:yes gene_type:complete
MQPFTKRTFTTLLFVASLSAAAVSLPRLCAVLVRPRLSAALREKIMLGVTSVNDCRYCSWVHTGLALENGVDMESLQELLQQNIHAANEREGVAILFGKHFADAVRKPSTAAKEKLAEYFTAAERREIMTYIHIIYFANLTGNSADALLARLQGRPTNGNPITQLVAACIGAPVLAAIWLNSKRASKRTMEGV